MKRPQAAGAILVALAIALALAWWGQGGAPAVDLVPREADATAAAGAAGIGAVPGPTAARGAAGGRAGPAASEGGAGGAGASDGAASAADAPGLAREDATGAPGLGELRLRVVDGQGAPVPGALAWIGHHPAHAVDESDAYVEEGELTRLTGTSGADGVVTLALDFPSVGDERVERLGVVRTGYALRVLREVRARAGERRDLGDVLLLPGRTVRGRVVGEAGAGLPGAALLAVRAESEDSGPSVPYMSVATTSNAVRADLDGRFELRDLWTGPVAVLALVEGHVPRAAVVLPGVETLTLRLERGIPVRGRVVREGVGVPGAVVNLWADDRDEDLALRSGPEGRFDFPSLAPGVEYRCSAWDAISGCPDDPTVRAERGASVHEVEIVLAPAPAPDGPGLRGVARTAEDGTPLPRLHLWVAGETEDGHRFSRGTEMPTTEGRFRVEHVPPGTYTVEARARGRAAVRLERVVVGSDATGPPLALALPREGATLAGTVRSTEGDAPLAGVRVQVLRPEALDRREVGPSALWSAAVTDATGAFRFDFLPPGPIQVQADGEAAGHGVLRPPVHDPAAGPLEIRLPPVASVVVVVRDAAGVLAPGRRLFVTGPGISMQTETDDAGEARASGLVLGPCRVGLALPGGGRDPATEREVAVEITALRRYDVVLRLSPPARIVGRVEAGTVPLADAWVRIAAQDTDGSTSVRTDPDGRYVSSGLPAGSYTVDVEAEGFLGAEVGPVEVREGATVTQDVRLGGGVARLTLRLAGSGPMLEGVPVTVTQGGRSVELRLGPGGVVVCRGTVAGPLALYCSTSPTDLVATVVLAGGAEQHVVTLAPEPEEG